MKIGSYTIPFTIGMILHWEAGVIEITVNGVALGTLTAKTTGNRWLNLCELEEQAEKFINDYVAKLEKDAGN